MNHDGDDLTLDLAPDALGVPAVVDREPPDRPARSPRPARTPYAVRFTAWGQLGTPHGVRVRRGDREFSRLADATRYAQAERRPGETAAVVHGATGGLILQVEP